MSEDFTLEFRGNYIHIQNAPDYKVTPASMEKLWSALADACETYDCLLVLGEGKIASRNMSMKNAFESGETAAATIPGLRLACCFEGYNPDITTDFFKLIARHRGATVEFFSDRNEALRWLGIKE